MKADQSNLIRAFKIYKQEKLLYAIDLLCVCHRIIQIKYRALTLKNKLKESFLYPNKRNKI